MRTVKWMSIEAIEKVAANMKVYASRFLEIPPPITYRAKIKLHGTNGGIRFDADKGIVAQSRERDLSIGSDNKGFCARVMADKPYFDLIRSMIFDPEKHECVVIYGEWAGKGIQKGVALSQVNENIFTVFAVMVRLKGQEEEEETIIVCPDNIQRMLQPLGLEKPSWLYILDWELDPITVNFFDTGSVQACASFINDAVEQCEAEDPWVKRIYGISGVGEGYVFYPYDPGRGNMYRRDWLSNIVFKSKGEKHRGKAQAKAVDLESADLKIAESSEFIKTFVTEGRLEQGLFEACDGVASKRNLGPFLKWIGNDIQKECAKEIEDSGLDWKSLAKAISNAAKIWLITKEKEQTFGE